MDAVRWTWVGVLGGAVAAAVGFWLTFPDTGSLAPEAMAPAPVGKAAVRVPPSDAKPPPRPGARRPGAPGGRKGKAARPARAPRGKAAGVRGGEPKEMPEGLADALAEHRADSVAKSEAKVLRFAEIAGWSDDTTDAVMGHIGRAHDDVDRLLADVTEGSRSWRDVQGEVREVRVEQARAIRDELGEEGFREFARALQKSSRRSKRRARRGVGRP